MKKLLDRSLRPLIVYALIVLVMSIPVYFAIINYIWVRELDKHHFAIREKIEERIRDLALPDSSIRETVGILNRIQPGFSFTPVLGIAGRDSLYTIIRFDSFMQEREQFRCMVTYIQINGKLYRLLIETNMEEIDETILAISAVTVLFLILLLAGFIYLNRKTSLKIWQPFYHSLEQVKSFRLDRGQDITFEKTEVIEFEELNGGLNTLIKGNLTAYKQQKEFTENASHELQTPLAIVKSKLDILLQNHDLTHEQLHIIEDVNQAINRVSRINKNLLLLAKIENAQFEDVATIDLADLLSETLEQFSGHVQAKNLLLTNEIQSQPVITASRILTEILLTNLITNAIRHTPEGGMVELILNAGSLRIANSGLESLDGKSLFKRFAQVSNQRVGSGLGLSIVKEVCKRNAWQVGYSFEDERHIFLVEFMNLE